MSIRHYIPRRRHRGVSTKARFAMLISLLATIFLQMAYPLLNGTALTVVTNTTVLMGALSMAIHAQLAYGRKYASRLIFITYLFAFTVELIGITTTWPFGVYTYDASLGIDVLGVPLIVPCAWIMMAHPVLIAARSLTKHWVFIYGGLTLAAWDYFLDPQMVEAGRWHWSDITSSLPGTPMIPLSNFFGWTLAGCGLMALLNFFLPFDRRKDGAHNTAISIFLTWVLFSAIVGNLFFFDRPIVALLSAVFFGGLITPYLLKSTLGDS